MLAMTGQKQCAHIQGSAVRQQTNGLSELPLWDILFMGFLVVGMPVGVLQASQRELNTGWCAGVADMPVDSQFQAMTVTWRRRRQAAKPNPNQQLQPHARPVNPTHRTTQHQQPPHLPCPQQAMSLTHPNASITLASVSTTKTSTRQVLQKTNSPTTTATNGYPNFTIALKHVRRHDQGRSAFFALPG